MHPVFTTGISIKELTLEPYWRIRFSGPIDDLDRIFNQVIQITDLRYGKTDRNASVTAPGIEYYRPMEGTPTGAESETRQRPDIPDMTLCIRPDEELLQSILKIIYQYHSYYEPPIHVEPVLRSATRGIDDSNNPHRWWNRDGDWKQSS